MKVAIMPAKWDPFEPLYYWFTFSRTTVVTLSPMNTCTPCYNWNVHVYPVKHTHSILRLFTHVVHTTHVQWQGGLLHSTIITVTVNEEIFVPEIFRLLNCLLHVIFMGQAMWLFLAALISHCGQIFMRTVFISQSTQENLSPMKMSLSTVGNTVCYF